MHNHVNLVDLILASGCKGFFKSTDELLISTALTCLLGQCASCGWNWIMCSLALANTRYSAVSENIASLQDTIALRVVVQYMKIESYCHIPNPTGHKTSPSKGCCFHLHHWQTTQQVAIFVIVKSGKMAKRGGGCWVAAPKNKFSLSHAKLSSAKPTCLLPNT